MCLWPANPAGKAVYHDYRTQNQAGVGPVHLVTGHGALSGCQTHHVGHGQPGQIYPGVAITAYNLHKIGRELLRQRRAEPQRRKAA